VTNADILELWIERAAAREYDGGASIGHAENRALMDVRKITGELPAWLVEHVERIQRERKENGGCGKAGMHP
jgi:hypothetical protein